MNRFARVAVFAGIAAAVAAGVALSFSLFREKPAEQGKGDLRFGKKQRAAAAAAAEAAKNGADLDTLRSLPYVGFSKQTRDEKDTGVKVHDTARAQAGYTLFTTRDLCTSELMDMNGGVVNTWSYPALLWANTKLLSDGSLLVIGADKPDDGQPRKKNQAPEGNGFLLRLTWGNEVVWKRDLPVHHDIDTLPDGSLVVLSSGLRDIPEVSTEHSVRDDYVTVLSPEGEVRESISLTDTMRSAPEPWTFEFGEPSWWEGWFGQDYHFQSPKIDRKKGGTMDLIHSNAARPIPPEFAVPGDPLRDPDNVLVTVRHQDAVLVLNRREKKIVWVWGPGEVVGPHDANWLPDGKILVFDNGLGRGWSRVMEVALGSGETVWDYTAPTPEDFYTATRGAAQRLQNGNTLITDSDNGHLFEVTRGGETVWEFWTPHRNQAGQLATITRSERIAVETVVRMMRAAQTAPPPVPLPDAGTPTPPDSRQD